MRNDEMNDIEESKEEVVQVVNDNFYNSDKESDNQDRAETRNAAAQQMWGAKLILLV